MFSVNYVSEKGDLEYDQRHKGPGRTILTDAIERHVVNISDTRNQPGELSLEREGFKPVKFDFDFSKFDDDEQMRAAMYPQVVSFLQDELGLADIKIFDHTYRSTSRNVKTVHNRAPVKTVHNDYTKTSAHKRMLEETVDSVHLRSRAFKLVNLWLPVKYVVEESPLAFIDMTSVESEDFRSLRLIYPDRVGEISAIKFNPSHRWFYQSRMAPGEGMLFKVFDSEVNSSVFGTPHSAVDLIKKEAALPRNSIEFRAIVFGEPR